MLVTKSNLRRPKIIRVNSPRRYQRLNPDPQVGLVLIARSTCRLVLSQVSL
jgi:hypothetical protein